MSYSKLFVGLFLWLALPLSYADDIEPFSVTLPGAVGLGDEQSDLISRLKQKAVQTWLKDRLGAARFGLYDPSVTVSFAERYVLKFQFGRSPSNPGEALLTGEVDARGLRAWIRQVDLARGNLSLRPLVVFSTQLQDLRLVPDRTAASIKETKLGGVHWGYITKIFQKFNAKISMLSGGGAFPLSPPSEEGDWRSLLSSNSENHNFIFWVHLTPTRELGTARLETYLYGVKQNKLLISRADEVVISAGDLTNANYLKSALSQAYDSLGSELDELVNRGILFGNYLRLTVEGLDSYLKFKEVEALLLKRDEIAQVTMKRIEPRLVEFEVVSLQEIDTLVKDLHALRLTGFQTKATKVDAQHLVLKLSQ